MNAHERHALLVGLVLASALAGCGSGLEADGSPDAGAEARTAPASAAEAHARVEEALRACMKEQGFDYTPAPFDATQPGLASVLTGADTASPTSARPSAEQAQRAGYSISTAAGDESTSAAESPTSGAGPGLDGAEQEAYDQALLGDLSSGVPEGGCLNDAAAAVGVDFGAHADRAGQYQEIDQRLVSDPRVVDGRSGWAGCMRDAGYSYASPDEPFQDFFERLSSIETTSPEGERTYDARALSQLQQQERATAVADQECYERHLADVEPRVRAELESELLGSAG